MLVAITLPAILFAHPTMHLDSHTHISAHKSLGFRANCIVSSRAKFMWPEHFMSFLEANKLLGLATGVERREAKLIFGWSQVGYRSSRVRDGRRRRKRLHLAATGPCPLAFSCPIKCGKV